MMMLSEQPLPRRPLLARASKNERPPARGRGGGGHSGLARGEGGLYHPRCAYIPGEGVWGGVARDDPQQGNAIISRVKANEG